MDRHDPVIEAKEMEKANTMVKMNCTQQRIRTTHVGIRFCVPGQRATLRSRGAVRTHRDDPGESVGESVAEPSELSDELECDARSGRPPTVPDRPVEEKEDAVPEAVPPLDGARGKGTDWIFAGASGGGWAR